MPGVGGSSESGIVEGDEREFEPPKDLRALTKEGCLGAFGLELKMCPPASTPPLFDLSVGSTDEEVMLFLGGRKAGDPIPSNVITQVNPFRLEPWDSPEGMWYLYNSSDYRSCTERSNSEVTGIAYWRFMNDITIFRDDDTAGRKIIREFYIGQAPFGNRTGWMMHEYHSDQKACHGSNFSQDYGSMCRLFLQNDQRPNISDFKLPDEEQNSPFIPYNDDDDAEHVECMLMRLFEDEERSSSTGVPNRSQPYTGSELVAHTVAGGEQVAALEERRPTLSKISFQDSNSFSASDLHAHLGFSIGEEYLEINNLFGPESASSSSDNSISSIMSLYSDEYFDTEDFLGYLGSAISQNMQEERQDFKISLSTSAKPGNEVIKHSQSSAGIIESNNSYQVGGEDIVADDVPCQENASKCCSSAYGSGMRSHPKRTHSSSSESSSNSHGSGSKSFRRIAKFGKKYCCFRPS